MKLDLEKGISLKIEGELGKNQTLSVDALINIAQSLQDLVLSIAKYDLPADEAIDLNNFKIELTDYQKGSSIPTFALTQNPTLITTSDCFQQRKEVSNKLNSLLNVSDKGTYYELKKIYPDPLKRNEFVEKLYNFNNSFKNSPVYIYEKDNSDFGYKPKRFKTKTKKELIVDIEQIEQEKTEESAFARVKIIKKGNKIRNKIEEIILSDKHSLSYSPEIINVNNRQYILQFPLRCLFEKEDDFYTIENELLDVIGTGLTQDEAEQNFNEEFDFLYHRLNQLTDEQLTKRLIRIKITLNSYIKEVL